MEEINKTDVVSIVDNEMNLTAVNQEICSYDFNENKEGYFLYMSDVTKSFKSHKVLKGVSFGIKKGEVLAIIGPSGSGKSTLLRCLTLLEKMDKGTIVLNNNTVINENLNKTLYPKDSELRKKSLHFGLVFQNFNLFPHLNVLQNLTLAPINVSKMSKEEAQILGRKLLKKVGLESKEKAYPCELSGGQQQRVAIARALAMSPDVICFDEPTSALDPELTGEVLKVIKSLKGGDTTMIVVTHEMSFARSVADKIMFLDEGEIIEFAEPDKIFRNNINARLSQFLSKFNEEI